MNKNDFSDLENQIVSKVSDAFKAIDMANLKKDINYKAEGAVNQFKVKFNECNKKNKQNISMYIKKRPFGSISGIVCIVFGTIGISIYGLSVLTFSVMKVFLSSIFVVGNGIFIILFLFFLVSLGLLLKGISLRKRVKRFNKYVRFMENNTYISIEELSKLTKEKERFLLKDLGKMIDVGMFLQGHIDDEKTYFILNDEVYNDYLNLKKQQIAKENNDKKLKEKIDNFEKEDAKSTIKIGRDYIEQIKTVRNHLHKEDISMELDKLGNISEQILNQVEKNPEKAQEVNKFIDHYLPITIKLINSYEELNNQVIQGDNIKNAKIEIEKSIDLINKAFENLLDDLFEDVVLDISTDISVLKTLFKQEGLGEEDFKNKK
ncbi:MAG: 5-bromo-4-chloroindolyl phosphate hydrolysis family protein [Terrisporobacter sp.]|uniref:5-bromo-4-chloroindolyl phosphate hydrolysis family protein n=1 Tax=Terrisporobacter sp. TaxID=1965305 RepID=UPI00399426DB